MQTRSVDLGVVVAVGVLQAGNHLRPILNLQIGLKYLDVHLLALGWAGTGSAGIVKREVAVVCFQKLRQGSGGSHSGLNVEGGIQRRLSHESLSCRAECNSKVRGRLD